MGLSVGAVSTILYFIGFIVINCSAGTKWQKKHDDVLYCYDCNSEYDPRCASDPFDSYTLGVANCTAREPPEHIEEKYKKATLCRKTIQKVGDKIRIIRGCGYVTSDRDNKECIKRSGTHDVKVTYCSCTKSLCNAGHHSTISSFHLLTAAVFTTTALAYNRWRSCIG